LRKRFIKIIGVIMSRSLEMEAEVAALLRVTASTNVESINEEIYDETELGYYLIPEPLPERPGRAAKTVKTYKKCENK
jgi:hypothetical protein